MKIVMIGAGAHRVLGILRSALALPGVLDGGEIVLVDLNNVRAEAMGQMLLKTPEQRRSNCRIQWKLSLEEALVGADVVGVIMPALSSRTFLQAGEVCLSHGFISSDNVSPTGSLCGVKIAPTVLHIARQMEIHCPNAWLVNFINPVAVISGMINNHTRIRTLGVCQGYTNHLWDISRIFGMDEEATDLKVTAAGINHLSYILKGTWRGEELFDALQRRITEDWAVPELNDRWGESGRANIHNSVSQLVRFWRELGVLIFSTEGDGMAHLKYEEEVERGHRARRTLSRDEMETALSQAAATRKANDKSFEAWINCDLTETFWSNHRKQDSRFGRVDNDIFVRIFAALSGVSEERIVTSRLNQGAISGIKDREVVEYTQRLFKDKITHEGPYEIPEVSQGLISGLAAHQTMLGDAIATEDPEMLARALISYPMNPFSRSSRSVFRELFALAGEEIAPALRSASRYF